MAKYRHRIFEMYEFRDETIRALTPKTERPATEGSESWTFKHLLVSLSANVTHVQFKELQTPSEGLASNHGSDFAELADCLGRDSKVLLDFSGVESFSAASIDALTEFQQMLQIKGSRIALCCLAPDVRKAFFAAS